MQQSKKPLKIEFRVLSKNDELFPITDDIKVLISLLQSFSCHAAFRQLLSSQTCYGHLSSELPNVTWCGSNGIMRCHVYTHTSPPKEGGIYVRIGSGGIYLQMYVTASHTCKGRCTYLLL